jgi:hypothetical protein
VVKRLKTGNPLGTLLHTDDARRVYQDAWKADLLCTVCEKAFCVWEDWVCKNVYDPFLATGNVKVRYDEKLGLFAASLAFRYMQFLFDRNPQKPVEAALQKILENLRVSLLNNNFASVSSYLYIHFLNPVEAPGSFPPGVNTYFFECIDGRCFDYYIPPRKTWMVYVKFPGLFFFLSGLDLKRNILPAAAVQADIIGAQGALDSSSQSDALMGLVFDFVVMGSTNIQKHYANMSQQRIAKNSAKIEAAPDKQNYRAHNSYVLDQKLLADWTKAKMP